ncbi:UDP-N-acetylglucosamine--N-acetylmuramyl-(pentapeptide) pyrophosphoryl-undecaprenol N-acetylglucosamine transferase [Neoehrlichia mikurensis]|uniref:UDP-N-acetylglucosamine--N-acetylmuramyl-(pentapeptide) pyrophosphoryl-undecaprenol N-acetylglucosamine transferase n=1 Tax=Neoehrlichia mikurensis TaxID=89586 RepID=A0A9Q9BXL5_9RICK|nr:UDP-N-acetylglucosamine--N-acetylmuramyl-(pentapeptide) pyrophosphoryl-undecaprenol N-acetylglucosamine transferase [Neoehrlichia mikurensis]UTO55273.1 UDP-N-acetylglucosamine--N-acetylmuramyl-(pentapeptide) pyrophosphoryl-undecaprenol N-acetylglucosamine transferase [Neoehrlichia mikurensis]UTO56193.1 UDP-N-acetylglucosamine--N-acetylmuramyl-(pentapeptide) pyrophosphoryl-undecaprenol N-acetylglucosamine transferase [Neoehrlichia mikurensis]
MSKLIILAAGGTGGHIFPAAVTYKKLTQEGYKCILFTDKKFQQYRDMYKEIKIYILPIHVKKGITNKLLFYISILYSYLLSYIYICKTKPFLVIGFGGYTSFPVVLAAQHKSINIVLHEQNSILGKVNRLFVKHAIVIATCLPLVQYVNENINKKSIVTGNPVNAIKSHNFKIKDKFNIVILGGSQGLCSFGSIIANAIVHLPQDIRSKISVFQQCNTKNIKIIQEQYITHDIKHELSTFFVNIKDILSNAHLIISRAGATTIAEVMLNGKPAIYIPYQYSADNHQLHNAKLLESLNAALCIEEKNLNYLFMKDILLDLFNNQTKLHTMAKNAKKYAIKDASDRLYNIIRKIDLEIPVFT